MDLGDSNKLVVFNFLSPLQTIEGQIPIALLVELAKLAAASWQQQEDQQDKVQQRLALIEDMVDKNMQQQAQLRGKVVQLHNTLNDIKRSLREK
jgi:septal ring factor EnvC (AmiA/AmiB activator)